MIHVIEGLQVRLLRGNGSRAAVVLFKHEIVPSGLGLRDLATVVLH